MENRSPASEDKALQVIDEFVACINAMDHEGHVRRLSFPHVRIANGEVRIWKDIEELGQDYLPMHSEPLEAGWVRSVFEKKEIIHSSEDKVHVAIQCVRYDENGTALTTFEAVYVVTCVDGHWGIQARSSFAPL